MPISHMCKNMNFTDMGTIGKCFTEFVFFGDATFASIIIIVMFALIAIKAQLPFEVTYPSILGLTFVLWLMSGSAWLMGLFIIGLLIGGVLLGFYFLNMLARG